MCIDTYIHVYIDSDFDTHTGMQASRRKEILKMIPGLGKKSSSKAAKNLPAASFFDMNTI